MKTTAQFCRFYLVQFYDRQPVASAFLAMSLFAVVISFGVWLQLAQSRRAVAHELSQFTAAHDARTLQRASVLTTGFAMPELPVFSSAHLIAEFHAISTDVKLPLTEVTYSLDNNATQPYLRYRVTLAVKSGYPEIRKFVAAVVAALNNVDFDSVQCGRENAGSTVLSCQLIFSAFYRKSAHG